jgi:hypothetical protein
MIILANILSIVGAVLGFLAMLGLCWVAWSFEHAGHEIDEDRDAGPPDPRPHRPPRPL